MGLERSSPTALTLWCCSAACSAFKAVPSLVASSTNALIAAAAKEQVSQAAHQAAGAPVPNSGTSLIAAVAASAGLINTSMQVGRSASFSSAPRTPVHPGGLHINVDGPAAAAAAGGSGQGAPASALFTQHLQSLAQHFVHFAGNGGSTAGSSGSSGVNSPSMPTTPGPYGPPGMARKPIWEM